jgi:hypothetical protein
LFSDTIFLSFGDGKRKGRRKEREEKRKKRICLQLPVLLSGHSPSPHNIFPKGNGGFMPPIAE